MGESRGAKRGPKKMVDIQGPSPPNSEAVYPKKKEGRQKYQEPSIDLQGAPGLI